MKKLAIAQMVLGMLVIGSLIFWAVWVSTGYLYAEGTVPGTDTVIGVFGNPGRVPLLEIWPLIYVSLGLVVLGCGLAQYLTARRQAGGIGRQAWGIRLAIAQIVLGAVIVGSLVWFIGWVELDYGSYTKLYKDVEVVMHPLPGWVMRLISWKVVSFVLGLAVLGCGIAQFVRARRLASAPKSSSRLPQGT